MEGDIDNIVKPILDGMATVIYPNDRLLERVVAQKFEPGIVFVFRSLTPILEQAIQAEPPVLYIRIDDDLSWRELA
jgi:crossover junction endodeoxyribonuclease RusA